MENIKDYNKNEIIYGKNAVTEALLSGTPVDTVYAAKNCGGLGRIISLARECGAVFKQTDEEKLRRLCGTGKHGGVCASTAAAAYFGVDDILRTAAEKNEPPFIVICDEIQDPHNLGAIIRTAEAAGAHGVIIPKRRSAGLNSTVFKTSAGAASWIKTARVNNISETVRTLKKQGIWVYAAEADGTPFYKTDLSGPIALVIGSEGQGVSRLVRENCDAVLSIDMYGRVNSLNASVSAAVLIYEAVRRRRKTN